MPMSFARLIALTSFLAHAAAGCCDEVRENAEAFIQDPHNQRCAVDSDCVVVGTQCMELESSFCHQVSMSREAANSSEWAEIERELGTCHVGKCTTCLAQLIAECNDGFCSR